MIVGISSGAEADVADGYWFYERQSIGLGDYSRTCIFGDIESLVYFGGIHEIENGFHRLLSKRFPFGIYYIDVLRLRTLHVREKYLCLRNN